MRLVRYIVLMLVVSLFALSGQGQSIVLDNDTVRIEGRYADEFVFYQKIDITNNDSLPLQTRWVITDKSLPAQWDMFMEDADSIYLSYQDTADFVLDVGVPQTNYIIISFYPNGQPGRASARIKLFNIQNPADSAILIVYANARLRTTGIADVQTEMIVYPNPVKDHLTVKATGSKFVYITDIAGKQLIMKNVSAGTTEIDVRKLPAGHYILHIQAENGHILTRQMIKEP